MMRMKQFFQLMMVALFLFTYQEITVHSKQHFDEAVSECHLCEASEHLDMHHHQETAPVVVNEHIAIKESAVEEKQIIQSAYDLTQNPQVRLVDLDGLNTKQFNTISLGYFSTAPPHIFL